MIKIDEKKCIGCGICELICPESFKINKGKSKYVHKKKEIISKKKKEILEKEILAEESCPVDAIKILK